MKAVNEGDLLWRPGAERVSQAHLTHYVNWLAERGRRFDSYASLWQWSIDDQDGFWGSLWEYFDVRASQPYERVLRARTMPGAEWFPGARLNYAQHALRHERPGADALLFLSERRTLSSLSWTDLGTQVRKLADQLRRFGVARGDRVVAYLPNSPEAVIAMLATVSVGAIWASCGPDFGPRGAYIDTVWIRVTIPRPTPCFIRPIICCIIAAVNHILKRWLIYWNSDSKGGILWAMVHNQPPLSYCLF